MDIVSWPMAALIPDPSNARKHDEKNLAAIKGSLAKFGQQKPIVINAENVIIAGNGTYQAAKELGWDKIKVVISELGKTEQIAFALADNRTSDLSEFDRQVLSDQLQALLDDKIDIEAFGFDKDEIIVPEMIGETDPDVIPEVTETRCKPGDLWILGNHRLMCGDSTNVQHCEQLMDGKKADMVFTDPPYGVDYSGGHNAKKREGIENDSLAGQDLTELFADALSNATIVSADHAAFYIWYANGKAVETFAAFASLPLKVRAVLCWYKVRSGLGAFMSQYIPNYEPCIYAFKNGCAPQWFGPTDEKTVWELQKERTNDFHPTQKPVELSERAIRNSSKTNDAILDLFLGSGSTLIACEKTNRRCFGMEIDPKYCDVILSRWEKFTGRKAEIHSNGTSDHI